MSVTGQTRRHFVKTVGLGALSTTLLTQCRADSSGRQPNFVVFFIDDLGYGDIEPFGSQTNRTPNLNRMASEGKKLSSFYVASPVCSPSRAALMTGSYPQRAGLETGSWYLVLMPGDELGISANEITLPEILSSAGYSTGCFGKWHLGDQPEFLPTRHGFDYYYGLPYSNDMWPEFKRWDFPPLPVMRNETVIGEIVDMDDQARITGDLTREAIQFIERNQERPFFLYFPHTMVHWPHAASEQFLNAAADDQYKAAVEEIDWSVGQILQTLRDLHLDENTLVLFTSDNGANVQGSNAPLRGGKNTTWEGGMRVPTIAWWPGQISPGTESDEITTTMDLLPTFARLAGGDIPDDRIIDGKDMSDILTGTPNARSIHEAFYYKLDAVRSGEWKYFDNGQLYHLGNDIGETSDVAQQHPDVVAHMRMLLTEGREDLNDPTRCRPVGRATGPLRFLIPRHGKVGEEAHSSVNPEATRL